MSVPAPLVRTEPHVKMQSMVILVNVLKAMKGNFVRRTLTSVPVSLVRTEAHVMMVSITTHVPVKLAMKEIIVRPTLMSVPVILVKMVGNARMVSMGITVHVCQDSQVSEMHFTQLLG